MKEIRWLLAWAVLLFAIGGVPAMSAAKSAPSSKKVQTDSPAKAGKAPVSVKGKTASQGSSKGPAGKAKSPATDDEEWVNAIWSQVDEMVQQKEYKAQNTVTVAAVRGAEAKNEILDKLYYKGGKRYPSQDKLRKAIETLKKAVAQDPKAADVPKERFFIAQCYEKLGESAQARAYYEQVIKAHPGSRWAEKSAKRLAKLPPAK